MKRQLMFLLIALAAALPAAGADGKERNTIDLPHRFFEIGISAAAGASNNYFSAADCMKKDLVLDFTKISDNMPKDGWIFDVNMAYRYSMDLNLKNGVHAGISASLDGGGTMKIGKELFDFLGKGNDFDEKLDIDGDVYGDMFAVMSAAAGFDLFGFHLEVMPSVFLPLLYVEADKISLTYENPEDGSISAKTEARVKVYSSTTIDSPLELSQDAMLSNSAAGVDIYSRLEHKIFGSLQGAVYSRIPIIPGTLNYSKTVTESMTFKMDKVMSGETRQESGSEVGEWEYSSAGFKHSRPFRLGAQVAWRPFGKWCTFGGLLGVAARNPFTDNVKVFPEYEFSASATVLYVLGFKFSSSYYNQIFKQEAGIMLNMRVLELNVGASVQGADFAGSFRGTGAGAFVSAAFGF